MNPPEKVLISASSCFYLKIFFLWPSKQDELDPPKSYFIKIAIIMILSFLSIAFPLMIHLLRALKADIDISEDLSLIMAFLGTNAIFIEFTVKQKKIAKLINDMSFLEEFGTPPDFNKDNKRLNLVGKIIFYYSFVGTICYNLSKLATIQHCRKDILEVCGVIIPIGLPFEMESWQKVLTVALVILVFIQIYTKINCFASFQVLELCWNIRIKFQHLSLLVDDCLKKRGSLVEARLGMCVRYHTAIISYGERLNDCFQGVLFLETVIAVVICGCLENQILQGSIVEPGAILHMVGWTLSLFITCWAGQILLDTSFLLTDAICNSNWYLHSPKIRKNLTFMMMRSQKPLSLQAGPLNVMCFALFVAIMKMSYSVLTLLS